MGVRRKTLLGEARDIVWRASVKNPATQSKWTLTAIIFNSVRPSSCCCYSQPEAAEISVAEPIVRGLENAEGDAVGLCTAFPSKIRQHTVQEPEIFIKRSRG